MDERVAQYLQFLVVLNHSATAALFLGAFLLAAFFLLRRFGRYRRCFSCANVILFL